MDLSLLQVDEGAHPVFWIGGMAFPGNVFGEKHIAGAKGLNRSIADTNLNRAGQGDAPLPPRGGVPS